MFATFEMLSSELYSYYPVIQMSLINILRIYLNLGCQICMTGATVTSSIFLDEEHGVGYMVHHLTSVFITPGPKRDSRSLLSRRQGLESLLSVHAGRSSPENECVVQALERPSIYTGCREKRDPPRISSSTSSRTRFNSWSYPLRIPVTRTRRVQKVQPPLVCIWSIPSLPPVNLTLILSFTYLERSRIASRFGLSMVGCDPCGPP